jgi:hypothetical protein
MQAKTILNFSIMAQTFPTFVLKKQYKMATKKSLAKSDVKNIPASKPSKNNDDSTNQAQKSSSKKTNQGKSKGEGKRPGIQGKAGRK